MKKFIKNAAVFIFIIGTVFLGLSIGIKKVLRGGNYYSINKHIDKVLFGHSHASNAFDDELITDFRNFGDAGESYFYTYYKAKKIIENNQQIKTVFIVLSNNQVASIANTWIWSDKYLNHTFPKYAAFIDHEGYNLLLKNNWKSLISSECIALRENLYFLVRSRKHPNYINERDWGKFGTSNKVFVDGEIEKTHVNEGVSITNISYLMKTIAMLKENKINVFLIRSPLHRNYQMNNETEFMKIITANNLSEMFLDFKNYPLSDNQFIDLEHLNLNGAKEFSIFFNKLLTDSLLQRADKTSYIKHQIEDVMLTKK